MEWMQKISAIVQESGFEEGLKEASLKIQEYPNSDSLIYNMALLMGGILVMKEGRTDIEKYKDIILSWYERCISSKEDRIRKGTLYMLVSKCINNEQFDDAQHDIDQLPEHNGLNKDLLKINTMLGKMKGMRQQNYRNVWFKRR